MELEPIIGLECHIQLKTQSKMFCGCSNRGEFEPPNTTICPICTGHPGTLPVINRVAVESAVKMSLALHCRVLDFMKWDRKNYFYPDLPKGYQISMYDLPIGVDGHLDVPVAGKMPTRIRIHRLHLEEDAAKSMHSPDQQWTFVDYNRAGTPLMEVVTEADFRSSAQAKRYLQELQTIARYLNVSEADMEKGHLRCDVNISLRPMGEERLWPKTEIKNVNSFKAVERAIGYETRRQSKLWEANTPPAETTTRGWNDAKQATIEQRWKEGEGDYRYFPEPDLPPVRTGPLQPIDPDALRILLPELPDAKRRRFIEQLHITPADVVLLTSDLALANFTEQTISELEEWIANTVDDDAQEAERRQKVGRTTSGWIASKLLGILNDRSIAFSDAKISPENFAELLNLFLSRRVNSTIAQELLGRMVSTNADPSQLLEELGGAQVSDGDALGSAVDAAIAANPGPVADYRGGKTNAVQFLVGKVMHAMNGAADPERVRELIKKRLS